MASHCQREKRAAERRLKAARFTNLKTLEDFKFDVSPLGEKGSRGASSKGYPKNQCAQLDKHYRISTADERTSVIVTTNLPFAQWTEVLGSERLTGAVLDRLIHRCHILKASGESYRLKDARRRSQGRKAAESPAQPQETDQAEPLI